MLTNISTVRRHARIQTSSHQTQCRAQATRQKPASDFIRYSVMPGMVQPLLGPSTASDSEAPTRASNLSSSSAARHSCCVVQDSCRVPEASSRRPCHGHPALAASWGVGFYGGGFYHPYYLGFGQWYPYPVFGVPAGPYPNDPAVALRLQVTPREALVFVDGYAAGIVDDYDGVFQRLQLIPGPHEIVIYHPGHRTLARIFTTIRDRRTRSGTPSMPLLARRNARAAAGSARAAGASTGARAARVPPATDGARTGTLALRVQPGDARVLIDGEPWQGPSRRIGSSIQLAEGSHRVRIEKPGFQPFAVDVDVRAGETTSFNVSLLAQ